MDLALNNLQRLICHKTQQTKPNQTKPEVLSIYLIREDSIKRQHKLPLLKFELASLITFSVLLAIITVPFQDASRRLWWCNC